MKKILCLVIAASVLVSMSGCSIVDTILNKIAPDSSGDDMVPGRMVSMIEIDLYPLDPDFHRCYTRQEKMSSVLQLLRDMTTDHQPDQEPDLHDGQSYYTITATYSNGSNQTYYLLGFRYLRRGDEEWCEIDSEKVMKFNEFILDTPSDTKNAA